MAIPILNELNEEITRLYVAGSPLAHGDPRLKKYIPALQKLGEKVPVFAALSAKLSALIESDEKSSPEALMEVGLLLYSVLYTQGETGAQGEVREPVYADAPLAVERTPYSKLHELIELLTSRSQSYTNLLEEAYESKRHNDPRLFEAYCEAITDNHTQISDYVEGTLIPSVGANMIPFLTEALDITGSKRHSRLFRLLYKLSGRGILQTAERALEKGAPHVMVEAIYALGEDAKYEETLLEYAGDKKAEVRKAAFAALAKLGSARGEEMVLAHLEKASIGHIEDALIATVDPAAADKVLAQAEALLPDYKTKAAKLKVLLRVLASRHEEKGLALIERLFADEAFFNAAGNTLELYTLAPLIADSDTPEKNELLYRLTDKNNYLSYYHVTACKRLFSKEEVYERLSRHGSVLQNYGSLYHVGWCAFVPDGEKTWDRRWASLFLARKMQPAMLCAYAYDDDEKTWSMLLALCAKKHSDHNMSALYYPAIFAHAFKIGHPQAAKYYHKLIQAGYSRETLDEAILRENPNIDLSETDKTDKKGASSLGGALRAFFMGKGDEDGERN